MTVYVFVGRHIEGIWHTAIVAYGREFFFGEIGIQSSRPVSTIFLLLSDCNINHRDDKVPSNLLLTNFD